MATTMSRRSIDEALSAMNGSPRFPTAVLILALAGCAAPPPVATPAALPAFPPPPAEPRVIYERTLQGSGDLATKAKASALLTMLTGTNGGDGPHGDGVSRPRALAVHRGRVFVANDQDRSVSVFDIPQQRFYKIGAEGPGLLKLPSGLSTDRTGNLFVADSGANAVLVFDAEGKYLRRIGGPKWFSQLTNVTADPQGDRIYAVDAGEAGQRVGVFASLDGRHLFDFGSRGRGPGEFTIPYDLAVGKDGRLYVVDSGNFRVQMFDRDGKYLGSFGTAGKRPGQFTRPKEIAADAGGNLYVVDGTVGNVQVFDAEGRFLFSIGAHGENGGAANYMLPTGIDIDDDGRIYIVDQWYGKIDVFRPLPLRASPATTSRKLQE
jgi:DNA-binding beta-propeller fold protein YncE